MPEKGKCREDYRLNGELSYGEAFGFSDAEIQYAIHTKDKVRDYYESLNKKSEQNVNGFIEICNDFL